jgi:hypothetical protein
MITIIALTGKAGSGKDTAANYLIENYGYQKMSFAETLKDAVAAVFGWPRDMLEGVTDESRRWREQKDEWWSCRLGMYISPRKVLMTWGTELCRDAFHQDIWIASLERKLLQLPADAKIVITDCRFDNEAKMIRDIGGKVVHIRRWLTAENGVNHRSESDVYVDNKDDILPNNGTLQELYDNMSRYIV